MEEETIILALGISTFKHIMLSVFVCVRGGYEQKTYITLTEL